MAPRGLGDGLRPLLYPCAQPGPGMEGALALGTRLSPRYLGFSLLLPRTPAPAPAQCGRRVVPTRNHLGGQAVAPWA